MEWWRDVGDEAEVEEGDIVNEREVDERDAGETRAGKNCPRVNGMSQPR